MTCGRAGTIRMERRVSARDNPSMLLDRMDDEAKARAIDGALVLTAMQSITHLMHAKRDGERLRAEIGLLQAVLDHASQVAGTKRRVSILKKDPSQQLMRLHLGLPETSFGNPPAEFTQPKGLVWAAITDCTAASNSGADPFDASVREYEPKQHPGFVNVPGEPPFKSILIAPIWAVHGPGADNGMGHPLGAVCLDSTKDKFYTLGDRILLITVARALALGWASVSNAPFASTVTVSPLASTHPMPPGAVPELK